MVHISRYHVLLIWEKLYVKRFKQGDTISYYYYINIIIITVVIIGIVITIIIIRLIKSGANFAVGFGNEK